MSDGESKREDTRDRDAARRKKKRERDLLEEQERVFSAISYEGDHAETDEVTRVLGQSLNKVIYVLIGILVLSVAVWGIERGLSAQHARGVLPLQEAAADGDLDDIRRLIADGAPVDRVGPDGATPLVAAIRNDHNEAVELLINAGAQPADYAMKLAMRYEHWQIVETLVRGGGDPDVRREWDARSPLELATERDDLQMVRMLLEHDADPDAVSNAGPSAKPALHYAAEHNMKEIVNLLLDAGADPTTMWLGYRARHLAEHAGHTEMVRVLAEAERGYVRNSE